MKTPPSAASNARPPHIEVSTSPAPAVEIRGRLRSGSAVVLALLGMATLGGLLFVTVSPRAEANPRNAVAVLVTVAALLGCAAAALALRVERVSLGEDDIVHARKLAGVTWKRRRMPRAGIDAVRVQTRGSGGRGVIVTGRDGRMLIGSSLDEAELDWLRQWLESHLARRAATNASLRS